MYEEIKRAPNSKHPKLIRVCNEKIKAPFEEWKKKKNKKMY
jgi:hypothetical protein